MWIAFAIDVVYSEKVNTEKVTQFCEKIYHSIIMNSIFLANAILHASHMGTWYPAGNQLTTMFDKAYSAASVSSSQKLVRAIIVPHAGYSFCIRTSMNAFKSIDPSLYDRVFVLGPSHQIPIRYCTIADASSAESPYGDIPFDVEVAEHLLNKFPSLFKKLDCRTAEIEHSLEIEFPILKYIFREKPFTLVPIMVGSISYKMCEKVAEALSEYASDPRTLFVISSDFCHWGARFGYQYLPEGDGKIYQKITQLDKEAADMIATGDSLKFKSYIDKTQNTICGRLPIMIMMHMFGEMEAEFPAYSLSENITSKYDSSVSYFAGVIRA
ncbi:Protein MEMO1 [Tritrichomonas foetus]|uniref:Protein MEMO1 n=1 Tax=Tritrichomonas foetus TaxID=1144522 RepID=A0A1J4KP83_9EUKA|nr:Protein MEMO1 [Tritrichomonas foetus]|eukprot:OHT13043.1 Protein MEMO1 [Tritrichomonas foetus]